MDNVIVDAHGHGVEAWEVTNLVAEGNIVGHCGGDGMKSDWPYSYDSAVLRKNTIFGNRGSAIALSGRTIHPAMVESNIGCGNLGWGLTVGGGVSVDLGCNDWFGNELGAVNGAVGVSTDRSVDPLFCGVDSADVGLDSASPLLGVWRCAPFLGQR
jgi:hypothetical protein